MSLCRRPDYILIPHIAWASDKAVKSLADPLMDNIEAFADVYPQNVVTGSGL